GNNHPCILVIKGESDSRPADWLVCLHNNLLIVSDRAENYSHGFVQYFTWLKASLTGLTKVADPLSELFVGAILCR
ncbi:MAG: hypothetical protein ACK518_00570, partial [bacterium]